MRFNDVFFSRKDRYSIGVELDCRATLCVDSSEQRAGGLRRVLRNFS